MQGSAKVGSDSDLLVYAVSSSDDYIDDYTCGATATRAGPRVLVILAFLDDRLAHHFFDRRHAVIDRHQPARPQGAHAALFGLQPQHLRAGVLNDQIAHLVVEGHDLIQTLPAAVAGVVALVAAFAVVEHAAFDILRPQLQLHQLFFGGLI